MPLTGQDADAHIPAVLGRVKREYLENSYQISDWDGAEDFLERLARRTGRLLKGGDPDLRSLLVP